MENVFLIASEFKKKEWKQYLDKITKNGIKWVEDTENRDGGYCVIAMKAYIEKREETFREIEEKYTEQLKRAKQVFIFHLKTGTSYVDHLEMIKGKKNWYYSVIDLDTGVPANSPHNKGVIKDFKHKLLSGRDTSDEQGLVMVGEEKKEKPTETSLESLEKICLELKAKDWNGETVADLLQKLKVGIGSISKKKLKIIVSGNIGSGKSSLINSFMGALSGKMWNAAGEGGRDDLLYSSCGVYFKHGPDLVCYEIRGTRTGEGDKIDILKTILEEKNDSGQTRDEDTIHVILYLVKDDKGLAYLQELKEKTENYNCFRYLVFTHMDIKYPILKGNIEAILKSDEVSGFVEEIHKKTEYPKEFILPVVNSVDTTMTDPYRTYFLYLLLKFVMIAKEAVEKQKQNKIQSLTPSMETPGGNCSVL